MWFKVDDSFYDHPKVFGLSDSAIALWVRAGSWASRFETDGRVPGDVTARLCEDPERAVKELLSAGLWVRVRGGGYRFHDWAKYQPLRSQSDRRRIAKSRGAIAANHRRWHVGRGLVVSSCELCEQPKHPNSDQTTDQTTDRFSDSLLIPPDPTPKDQPPVVAPVSDLLQDVVNPALPRDAHTHARRPGRSGLPHEAVMAALGATPSEAHAVVARIRSQHTPDNLTAFTNALINRGAAQQMLTEHRAAVHRAERADWGRRRRQAPECAHGIPGGDWTHPDPPHRPVCLNCRLEGARTVA